MTPGGSRSVGGITPGAMSMAGANTPYGQTPGLSRSAPYTPTANTPFMTPYTNTPGIYSLIFVLLTDNSTLKLCFVLDLPTT